jgi:hypothetical protein
MSDARVSQTEQDLRALENFVVGNEDLERLEVLLDRFNIFEATGFIRQELRHSDFLAFLLDPQGNHGLEDAFVKRLLQRVLVTAESVPVSVTPMELEQWDLDRMEVRREWQYIDILLLDEDHKLAVIIENKIDSDERLGQLRRHLDVVGQHFPGWRVIPVYLTRGGDPPSHESYLPIGYGLVCDVIEGLAEEPGSVVNPDVKVSLEHYSDMLRRNIVSDSDVAKLCRRIYHQHKRALDVIFDHRPDPQTDIGNLLLNLIDSDERVTPTRRTKKPYIYFYPTEWGASPHGSLDFVFHNHPDSLDLFIEVRWADDVTRRNLFDVARRYESLFDGFIEEPRRGLNPKMYRRTFLTRRFYEEASDSDREAEIRRRWSEFLNEDLSRLDEVIQGQRWIWESDEAQASSGGRFVRGEGDIEIAKRSDEARE